MVAMPGGTPRPNHGVYVRVLRAMTPEHRLRKAFELAATARAMLEHGLRRRFPDLGDEYMVTGSLASSLQGEPRATHDIDVVPAIREPAAPSPPP